MERKTGDRLPFRTRILLVILAVALGSLGIFFAGSCYFSVRMAEQNYAQAVTGPMASQIARFDDAMREAYRTAVRAANDEALRERAAAYAALNEPAVEDALALYDRLAALRDAGHADGLALYFPAQGRLVTSSEYRMVSETPPEGAPAWAAAPLPDSLAPYVYWDEAGSVPRGQYAYFRDLTDDAGAVLARVCVTVDERTMYYELLEQPGVQSGMAVYLLSDADTVVSADSSAARGRAFAELTGREASSARTDFGSTGTRRLYATARGGFSGFTILCLTDRGALTDELAGMAWLLLLLLAGVCAAAALLARTLSGWLYRPVGALMDTMERVGGGDMGARAPGGNDEFGAIGARFNQMMGEIDDLLGDLVDARVETRQAELEALQQQIKPHFMYNTLNSIKFAAILQGNEEIGALLGSFIELLEASISKKGAFIPLSDELRLVEDYAALQKYRYMDSFSVVCRVPPEAAGCYVPRLLLQPLVENAILHGIAPRGTDNVITVEAAVCGDTLRLSVSDNGKGMDETACRALLAHDPADSRRFTGIGLRNVRERLRLYYGERASFEVRSAPGCGTRIELQLPVSREEQGAGNDEA